MRLPLSFDAGTLTVNAKWKKQKDGTYALKKGKSVRLSVTANGVSKTFTLKKYRDYDNLIVTDSASRTVTVSGMGNFSGTRSFTGTHDNRVEKTSE